MGKHPMGRFQLIRAGTVGFRDGLGMTSMFRDNCSNSDGWGLLYYVLPVPAI